MLMGRPRHVTQYDAVMLKREARRSRGTLRLVEQHDELQHSRSREVRIPGVTPLLRTFRAVRDRPRWPACQCMRRVDLPHPRWPLPAAKPADPRTVFSRAPSSGGDLEGLSNPARRLLIERLHVVTVIRDRVFFESHQTRTILSLVDGAAGFRYGSYSPTEIFALSGGRRARTT